MKTLSILSAVILSVSLVACGGGDAPDTYMTHKDTTINVPTDATIDPVIDPNSVTEATDNAAKIETITVKSTTCATVDNVLICAD